MFVRGAGAAGGGTACAGAALAGTPAVEGDHAARAWATAFAFAAARPGSLSRNRTLSTLEDGCVSSTPERNSPIWLAVVDDDRCACFASPAIAWSFRMESASATAGLFADVRPESTCCARAGSNASTADSDSIALFVSQTQSRPPTVTAMNRAITL